MINFNQFWQMMYDHGSRNFYKNDTYVCWQQLSPEQQQTIYERIGEKIRTGRFVSYDPVEAIHDNFPRKRNAPQLPPAPPTNYNHSGDFDRMVATGTLVTAEYQGQVGIYTEADATKHHMRIIKHLQA